MGGSASEGVEGIVREGNKKVEKSHVTRDEIRERARRGLSKLAARVAKAVEETQTQGRATKKTQA